MMFIPYFYRKYEKDNEWRILNKKKRLKRTLDKKRKNKMNTTTSTTAVFSTLQDEIELAAHLDNGELFKIVC